MEQRKLASSNMHGTPYVCGGFWQLKGQSVTLSLELKNVPETKLMFLHDLTVVLIAFDLLLEQIFKQAYCCQIKAVKHGINFHAGTLAVVH